MEWVSELRPSTGLLFILHLIYECRATVEWYWQGKTEVLGEKPVIVSIRPPQILCRLAWAQTGASVVRGRQLTARAMAWPWSWISFFRKILQTNMVDNRRNLFPTTLQEHEMWTDTVHTRTFLCYQSNTELTSFCWYNGILMFHLRKTKFSLADPSGRAV
jgi:hypothetical protein